MKEKVFLVYAVETTPHKFSSDWQDHRRFKIVRAYLDENQAQEYRNFLLKRGGYSAFIETQNLFDE